MKNRNWLSWITIILLAFVATACSSPNPQPAGLTPIPTLPPGATPTLVQALQNQPAAIRAPANVTPDAALGSSVFLQNCSPCHGINGQGVNAPALRNNKLVQAGGDPVFQTIANGHPGTAMPAWLQTRGGTLTETQINNVIGYLNTLQNVASLPTATPQPTETPSPANAPTPEPARPSEPGGSGSAVGLQGDATRGMPLFGKYCAVCHGPEGVQGLPNPGSNDGSIPVLNPMDPSIANANPKTFAANVDVFIEHGSVPAGPNPTIRMPSFGDSKMLTAQQIADLIAYLMQMNKSP